jgi:hypothetical protein
MTDEEYKQALRERAQLKRQQEAAALAAKQAGQLGVPGGPAAVPPPDLTGIDPATAAAQARAQVAQQRAATEAPLVGANPSQDDPGAIDKMLWGTGSYDPTIPNTPPNVFGRGMSPGQLAAVGGSMLTTSDPDALANIWTQNVPGAERGRDVKGATTVQVPMQGGPPYQFHPNPPGALDVPSILGFAGQGATDAAALAATGGAAPATMMGVAQLGRGEAGRLSGTQESQGDILKGAAGAALFAKLGEAVPSIGGGLYRGTKTALSQTFGRTVNEDLTAQAFRKAGFDWDNLPDAGKKRILDSMQGWSPSEALAALQNRKNVEALWQKQSAAEFGVEGGISKGKASGDPAQLDREALLARKAPESRLALQGQEIDPSTGRPYPVLPGKLPGLLDDKLARGDVESGMAEVQKALKSLPPAEQAQLAERQAWTGVTDKLSSLKLANAQKTGPLRFIDESLGKNFDFDRSPATMNALSEITQVRTAGYSRAGIPVSKAIELRTRIDNALNEARRIDNRIDVENLTKLRTGFDKWLDSNPALAGSAEFQGARKAQAEAFKHGPDAPTSDHAEKIVRELRNDTANLIQPDSAWEMAAKGEHGPEVMRQIVEQLGGPGHPGVVKLQGGYLREQLLDANTASIADMSAGALSKKLSGILDDGVAKNLFPPGELAGMRRARDLLDAMDRKGARPEATWKAVRDLATSLPALAVAIGAGAAGGIVPFGAAILGRRAVGAVTRPVTEAIGGIGAGRAAARQMDFPGIAFRPSAAGPGATGAGAVLGAAANPYLPGEEGTLPRRPPRGGLMNYPQPLAVEGAGLLGP